ncbi:ferric reductase-like transmembrane domain-containing protein [Azonexus hydrophilus]|uniref:ferredoxin reductase family protein n=1 Tax=Azonexus hydrophilus TaxID=418702 RepID=UPI0003FB89A1
MVRGVLVLLTATLALLWGWDVWQAPASPAHPWWIARQEAMYLSGLLAIGLMSLAMYLATRPAWLETPLGGMDSVYRAHKWAGIVGGSFAILHWLVEMSDDILKSTIGRAGRVPKEKATGLLDSMQDLAEDFGEWGFYILLVLLAITLWQRFPYRPWRFLHRAMPVIYLLLAFHSVLLAPRDYWTQPVGWVLAGLVAAGVYGALRALLGNIGQARRMRSEILAVTQPAPDVVAVSCRLPAAWHGHRAGQFALVTFDPDEGAHPFTIASADSGDRTVEFRIKALGDHTRQLPSLLRPGQPVDIEGPYGRFDLSRINPQARQFWVAGGIGVTPFLAWLGALQNSAAPVPAADLHYCTRDRERDPFVAELQALCTGLPSVRLHVHGAAQGEVLDAHRLLADAGPGEAAEVWFCGPGGLADALRRGIAGIGRQRLSFHQEAFVMR